MYNSLSNKEKDAIVYCRHLDDRVREHYIKFIRVKAVDKMSFNLFNIANRIEHKKYDRTDYEILRDIRMSLKEWDGHHYHIFLACRIIQLLGFEE